MLGLEVERADEDGGGYGDGQQRLQPRRAPRAYAGRRVAVLQRVTDRQKSREDPCASQ